MTTSECRVSVSQLPTIYTDTERSSRNPGNRTPPKANNNEAAEFLMNCPPIQTGAGSRRACGNRCPEVEGPCPQCARVACDSREVRWK